jgi:transcriptional regulator with XRE-family HTH domain
MSSGLVLTRTPDPVTLFVAGGTLIAPLTGTASSTGPAPTSRYEGLRTTQAGYSTIRLAVGSVTNEVRSLQDEIRERSGLTRQQIARALDIDRRSLSAWASGASRPSPHRLDALRFLGALVRNLDTRHPGRAQELLLAKHGDDDALSAIRTGRFDLAERLALSAEGRPSVSISRIARIRTPLYAAAAQALAAGRLSRPESSRTVRDDTAYEMDLAEAALFGEEASGDPRRRGYR